MKRIIGLCLVLAIVGVMVFAVTSVAFAGKKPGGGGGGGGCNCTDIYAPVICSNGIVYPNACYASCAKATGCVPYGDAT